MAVKVLHPLYKILRDVIEDTGQERVAEIENGALLAFALMKYVGMPVDKTAWGAKAEKVEAELKDLERRMLDAEWMPAREPVSQTWALQGADTIRGGNGKDRQYGGYGNDVIYSQGGYRDLVNCGKGIDTAYVDSKDQVVGCERKR